MVMFARALQLTEEDLNGMGLNEGADPSAGPSPAAQAQDSVIPEDPDAPKECQVCFDTKHTDLFPHTTEASGCRCLSDSCLLCLQQHMKTQMSSKEWKEGSLTCPTCNRSLTHQEIEEYADGATLST